MTLLFFVYDFFSGARFCLFCSFAWHDTYESALF